MIVKMAPRAEDESGVVHDVYTGRANKEKEQYVSRHSRGLPAFFRTETRKPELGNSASSKC